VREPLAANRSAILRTRGLLRHERAPAPKVRRAEFAAREGRWAGTIDGRRSVRVVPEGEWGYAAAAE